jgi:type IV secretion system protein VirB2
MYKVFNSLSPRAKKVLSFLSFFAFAAVSTWASTGTSMPWDSPLQTVLNAVSGNTVKIIGGIAIVIGGISAMFAHDQAIKTILWVIAGLGVAVNAVSLVNTFFGGSTGALLF